MEKYTSIFILFDSDWDLIIYFSDTQSVKGAMWGKVYQSA